MAVYTDDKRDSDEDQGESYYRRELKEIEDNYGQTAEDPHDEKKPDAEGTPTPGQLKQAEADSGTRDKPSKEKEDPDEESRWYRAGKKIVLGSVGIGANRGLKKYRKILIGTLIFNVLIGGILLLISTLSPLKSVHFETVLRSANFARYQLVARKQFSRVLFEAAVLNQASVGTYRYSPLVRQIQGGVSDKRIKALGSSGLVKWEFRGNRSTWQAYSDKLPVTETLKAVTIGDQRFDIDETSRRLFGRDYQELTIREKWTVGAQFTRDIAPHMERALKTLPLHVRLNPIYQVTHVVHKGFSGLLNKAKEWAGKKPDEATALRVDQKTQDISSSVTSDGHFRRQSGVSDPLNDAAEAKFEADKTAQEEGTAPGEIRSEYGKWMKGAKKFSTAVFASTVVCVGNDLVNYFSTAEGERVAQAARFIMDIYSNSAQQRYGDTVSEAVGAINREWDAVPGQTADAAQSVVYQMLTSQNVNMASAEYAAQMSRIPAYTYSSMLVDMGKFTAGVVNSLGPTFQDFCSLVLNSKFQYGVTAAETIAAAWSLGSIKGLTDGARVFGTMAFHGITGYAIADLTDWMIQRAINSVANTDFLFERGADRMGAAFVAGRALGEVSNRLETVGRPLTPQETVVIDHEATDTLQRENRELSFSHRYFAIDNPYSLLGRVVARMPTSSGGLASTAYNGMAFLGSILSSPFKIIGSLNNSGLFGTARAAEQSDITNLSSLATDTGVKAWGWSVDELNKIDNDVSFSLPNLVSKVEPILPSLETRYGICYDESRPMQDQIPDECYDGRLSEPNALYYRYYKALMFNAKNFLGPL